MKEWKYGSIKNINLQKWVSKTNIWLIYSIPKQFKTVEKIVTTKDSNIFFIFVNWFHGVVGYHITLT